MKERKKKESRDVLLVLSHLRLIPHLVVKSVMPASDS